MQLLMFVTDDGTPEGSGPLLFVVDHPLAVLPPNPRSLEWRYFATIEKDDNLFLAEGEAGHSALAEDGFYISSRLISR
jgi:hypothetical protein